jgi:hypothetical protein
MCVCMCVCVCACVRVCEILEMQPRCNFPWKAKGRTEVGEKDRGRESNTHSSEQQEPHPRGLVMARRHPGSEWPTRLDAFQPTQPL